MSFKKYIEQVKSQNKTSKPLIKKPRQSVSDTLDRGEATKIKQKNTLIELIFLSQIRAEMSPEKHIYIVLN